jgi:hypothetical protein
MNWDSFETDAGGIEFWEEAQWVTADQQKLHAGQMSPEHKVRALLQFLGNASNAPFVKGYPNFGGEIAQGMAEASWDRWVDDPLNGLSDRNLCLLKSLLTEIGRDHLKGVRLSVSVKKL